VQIIVISSKTILIFENLQINFTLEQNDKITIAIEKSTMNKKQYILRYKKKAL
jgi:hypothetical protein